MRILNVILWFVSFSCFFYLSVYAMTQILNELR